MRCRTLWTTMRNEPSVDFVLYRLLGTVRTVGLCPVQSTATVVYCSFLSHGAFAAAGVTLQLCLSCTSYRRTTIQPHHRIRIRDRACENCFSPSHDHATASWSGTGNDAETSALLSKNSAANEGRQHTVPVRHRYREVPGAPPCSYPGERARSP